MHLSSKRRLPGKPPLRIRWVGGILLWALLLVGFPVRIAPVRGASMEPTLHDGQWLCYHDHPWLAENLERGELVVFRSPIQPGARYVKRVVGLAGDELRFEHGLLRVNGRPIKLPGGAVPADMVLSVRVPPGYFYALGDHGAVSYDSRRFGPVALDQLVGRVLTTLGE